MAKRNPTVADTICVDPSRATPLYLQIARWLEADIVAGRLKPAERLPTVRELAVALNVTTSVVQKAMAELQSVGLAVSQNRTGIFVSARHHDDLRAERQNRFARQTSEDIERLGYDADEVARIIAQGTEPA